MILDKINLLSLLDQSFTHNFSRVTVTQSADINPITFSGPGDLFIKNGVLTIKLHHEYVDDEKVRYANQAFVGQAGELVSDHSYYKIVGADTNGLHWESEWSELSADFGLKSSVLIGQLNKFRRGDLGGAPATRAILVFQGNIEFPCYTSKEAQLNFQAGDLDVRVENHERFSAVIVSGQDIAQSDIDALIQSLEIASGQLLQLLAISCIGERGSTIELHSVIENMLNDRFDTPISLSVPSHQKDFISFVSHMYSFSKNDGAILYGYWHKIQRAHQSGLISAALPLTVSLESVLKHYWHALGEDVDFKLLAAEALPKLDQLKVNSRVIGRLQSSLNSAGSFTVKNCLRSLVAQGLITQVHLKSWDKLRNQAAHGDKNHQDPVRKQEFVDLFFDNVDFLFLLIISLIQYSGCRVDYSLRGFPTISQ